MLDETKNAIPRGVHRPLCLTRGGSPYLIAVTSDHRCIARAVVYPWDNEDEVAAVLWRQLNREDPKREPWQGGDDG